MEHADKRLARLILDATKTIAGIKIQKAAEIVAAAKAVITSPALDNGGRRQPAQGPMAEVPKIEIKEINPVMLGKLSAPEILSLNRRTHQLYGAYFAGNDKTSADSFSREDLINAQIFMIDEMKKRKIKVDAGTELNREAEAARRQLTEKRIGAQLWGSPAGKSRIANRLIPLFPEHKTYCEPFAGGAAVFWAKEKVDTEALNDMDGDIAAAFRFTRDMTAMDIETLKRMSWATSAQRHRELQASKPTTKAAAFHRFVMTRYVGFMRDASSDPDRAKLNRTITVPTRLEAAKKRLEGVKIFGEDYRAVVKRFDCLDAFFFLDPPYTKTAQNVGESGFDHAAFWKFLGTLKGKFMVTYDAPDPDRKFNLKILEHAVTDGSGGSNRIYKTHVITNYKTKSLAKLDASPPSWIHKAAHAGAMVAIVAPSSIKNQLKSLGLLKTPNAEPNNLHVTLLYLGEAKSIDEPTRNKIRQAIDAVSKQHGKLEMKISGFGAFNAGPDGIPVYAVANAKGLSQLQADLERAIDKIIKLPSEHGWVPHLTLGYLKGDDTFKPPQLTNDNAPKWTASEVALVFAGKADSFKLDGPSSQYATINPSGENDGPPVAIGEILPHYQKPMLLRSPAVFLVGSTANNGKGNDIDILIDGPLDEQTRHVLQFRIGRALPPKLSQRIQFHDEQMGGPFTSHVPLYDLALIPCRDREVIEMVEKQADSLLEYPPKANEKHPAVAQFHFRGKTAHLDFRIKMNPDYLVGWTISLAKAGAVPDVDTLEQARTITSQFEADGSKWNKPILAPNKLFAVPKPSHPTEWLGLKEQVIEPGSVGATRFEQGVFTVLDNPKIEWGTQKRSFHEYFVTGSKHFNGILYFRQLVGREAPGAGVEEGSKTPAGKTFWNVWLSKEYLPTVLKKGQKDMPPDGHSAMPRSLMEQTPEQFRFWEKKGEDARKMRDALVADDYFTSDHLDLVGGEIRRVGKNLYVPRSEERKANADQPTRSEALTFIQHAEQWVKERGLLDPDSDYDGMLGRAVLRMAKLFSKERHSGMSAHFARAYFNWLCDAYDGLHTMMLNDKDYAKARKALAKFAIEQTETIIEKFLTIECTASRADPESDEKVLDVCKAMHRKDACMQCSAEPTVECRWAEGRARAWFCDDHWQEWRTEGDGKDDVDYFRWIDGGEVGKKYGEAPANKDRNPKEPDPSKAVGKEVEKYIRLLPVEKGSEEQRIVLGIVLEPDTVDSQGDTVTAETIAPAAHEWLAKWRNRGVMHQKLVNGKIEVYESYLAPQDLTIGGQRVKKGSWLLMYHILCDELWAKIKSGEFTGFSMGGFGRRTHLQAT